MPNNLPDTFGIRRGARLRIRRERRTRRRHGDVEMANFLLWRVTRLPVGKNAGPFFDAALARSAKIWTIRPRA